jgi:hypothetical protein
VEVEIAGGQRHAELVAGLDLFVDWNLLDGEGRIARIEEVAQHAVEGLAVVAPIVVSGVLIDVVADVEKPVIEPVDWRRGLHQGSDGILRAKAAGVARVVGEQRGPRGSDGSEVCVVRDRR